MTPLQAWYKTATPEQKRLLAEHAGTTPGTLRQIVGAWRTGGIPRTTPEMAIAIERAATELCIIPYEGRIRREDLCAACNGCDYAADAQANQKRRKSR